MDCVEDDTWRIVNADLSLLIRRTNSPVCKEVVDNLKKQIENTQTNYASLNDNDVFEFFCLKIIIFF